MSPTEQILNILKAQEMSGRDLRAEFNKGKWFWQRWSTSAFYLLMSKLQEAKLVQYRDVPTNPVRKFLAPDIAVECFIRYYRRRYESR